MAKERRDSKNRILGKGEYQKEDGRYMYRYIDASGKARFVYSWTLTKSDRTPKGRPPGVCLRDLEHQIESDIINGINTHKAKSLTFEDYFEKFLKQKRNIKRSTRCVYRQKYDLYLKNRIGSKSISSIKYSDVCACYGEIIDEHGLSASTMATINSVLVGALKIAVKDEALRYNPAEDALQDVLGAVGGRGNKRFALTIPQQNAFMAFLFEETLYSKWRDLFVIMLGTGCRIGEICGLTWDDCDFDKNIIHIRRTVTYAGDEHTGEYHWHIQTPKSESGERNIPMLNDVKIALQNIKREQLTNGFCTSVIDGVSGFVFTNRNRTILIPNEVNKVISRIVSARNKKEKAAAESEGRDWIVLPDFSPHILRHTFCTRLCEAGIDIKVIQDVMGHSSVSVTMDVYNNVTSEYKQETFKKIESVLKLG